MLSRITVKHGAILKHKVRNTLFVWCIACVSRILAKYILSFSIFDCFFFHMIYKNFVFLFPRILVRCFDRNSNKTEKTPWRGERTKGNRVPFRFFFSYFHKYTFNSFSLERVDGTRYFVKATLKFRKCPSDIKRSE